MRRVVGVAAALLAACGEPSGRPPAASVSAPLALAPGGETLWVVAPHADVVVPVDLASLTAGPPVAVGRLPVAVAATGDAVLVVNQADGTLTVRRGDRRVDVPVGPEPAGVAVAPDGRRAFVTVSSAGEVVTVDLAAGPAVVARTPVGPQPWTVGVGAGGAVVVTHRLSRLRPGGREATDDGREGWLTVLGEGEVALPPGEGGHPNLVEGLALHDGVVWAAHVLDAPALPRDFRHSVSAGLSFVGRDGATGRIHLNAPELSTPVNFPRALALSPDGRTLYVVLAGSDAVMGLDVTEPAAPRLLGFWPTGANPRGMVVDAAGERGYVMNRLSGDVSVLDLTDLAARREIARVPIAPRTGDPQVLRGEILFNRATDPRLSRLGWMSCASCHPDGGSDGVTWVTPDGPRQTMPLWGLDGTAPFHASGTRDEIQDFEEDIERLMGGLGLAPGPALPPLGPPNGGRSADLDALAAFVLGGVRVPAAPVADDGAGRAVFERAGCPACHGGPAWTTSRLPDPPPARGPVVREALHDVGTFDPSADVLGAEGFDAPTLLGLHATAPYLHDGRAPRLEDVLADPRHAPSLSRASRRALVSFLRSIDADTPPFARP